MSTIKTNNIQHVDATSANIALDSSGGLTVDTNVLVVDATNNRVGVGTASPVAPLHISGAELRLQNDTKFEIGFRGTSGSTSLAFRDAYAGSDRVTIDSSGRLLVGTSTARNNIYYATNATTPPIQAEVATNSYSAGMSLINYSASGYNPWLTLGASSSNTLGTNTALGGSYQLGGINFVGADGTNFRSGATIFAVNDQGGAWASGDCPARLVFSVTRDGESSPTERLRITNTGFVKMTGSHTVVSGVSDRHEISGGASGDMLHIARYNSTQSGEITVIGTTGSPNSGYFLLSMYSGNGSTVAFNDREFAFRTDGTANADGSWNGGGADYAEYFEWSDGNPDEDDRRGISVVLDGDQIRPAVDGEDPIGVISGNPSVVGDAAWNKWSGKYLRDEYGTYIVEEYEGTNEEGETVTYQRRSLNPAYDPEQKYVPREDRPEWDCVGLMGKLRIRKGQPTGSRWIKMRDISDSVEEWLVR